MYLVPIGSGNLLWAELLDGLGRGDRSSHQLYKSQVSRLMLMSNKGHCLTYLVDCCRGTPRVHCRV